MEILISIFRLSFFSLEKNENCFFKDFTVFPESFEGAIVFIDLWNPDWDLLNPDWDLVNPDWDLQNPDWDLLNPDLDLQNPDRDLSFKKIDVKALS